MVWGDIEFRLGLDQAGIYRRLRYTADDVADLPQDRRSFGNYSGPRVMTERIPSIAPSSWDMFFQAVEMGLPTDSAAAMCAIPQEMLDAVAIKDKNFKIRLRQAEARSMARYVAKILRAADKNWHAAQFLLERRFPEHWAKPSERMALRDTGSSSVAIAEKVAALIGYSQTQHLVEDGTDNDVRDPDLLSIDSEEDDAGDDSFEGEGV